MSIFDLHTAVLDDYRDFGRSFFSIADDRARDYVERALSLIAAVLSVRAYQRQRWNFHSSTIPDYAFGDTDRRECSRQDERRALRFPRRKNRVIIGSRPKGLNEDRSLPSRALLARYPRSALVSG